MNALANILTGIKFDTGSILQFLYNSLYKVPQYFEDNRLKIVIFIILALLLKNTLTYAIWAAVIALIFLIVKPYLFA